MRKTLNLLTLQRRSGIYSDFFIRHKALLLMVLMANLSNYRKRRTVRVRKIHVRHRGYEFLVRLLL